MNMINQKNIKYAINEIKKKGNYDYNEIEINNSGDLFVERKGIHKTKYCSS